MKCFFELSDKMFMKDFKCFVYQAYFLNLPAPSCCSSFGFLIFGFVTLSTPSYCVFYNGTFVSPTTTEQIYLRNVAVRYGKYRNRTAKIKNRTALR